MSHSQSASTNKYKSLTTQERRAIAEWLLTKSKNGKAIYGFQKEASILFDVNLRTVVRIWKQAKLCVANETALDVSTNHVGNVGRKRAPFDTNLIKGVPLRRRTNIRSLAYAVNMSTTTVYRRIKEGAVRAHTNSIKPHLTEENKKARIQFCLSMLQFSTVHPNPMFLDMFNYVHIDEKWFFLTKTSEKYYLLPEESNPYRSCRSKKFITKVMFMAAVARPRFDEDGAELFSGKIGIFPFVFNEPAKRTSKNRFAGTLETKPILSVTKDVTRACLIEKVLPAIRAKWPLSQRNVPIFIQQDNARPHLSVNDLEFTKAAQQGGFDIRLCFQPPNSPDLNVLDLGFFRAIQSLQHQMAPKTIDELVNAVETSFNEMKVERLNHVFLTLQSCMVEIMKDKGGNNYKVPHMQKERLEREGNLPNQVCCDISIANEAIAQLQGVRDNNEAIAEHC